jgi:2-polyprenyl-3-methyl-5-hydroxy-6-metoxy-1,4-benzoquinol methylase
MICFRTRSQLAEAMDNPGLAAEDLAPVFRDLNRTNVLLRGQRITLGAVMEVMRKSPRSKYNIVDMGCGDGDLLRRLAVLCRESAKNVSLLGIDTSSAALEVARGLSEDFPEIQYARHNILEMDYEAFRCDILLCTLTLHHFKDENILKLLAGFRLMRPISIIINDLQRNKLAYCLFQVFSLIFIKTKIAKQDGLISIRSGFVRSDLQRFGTAIPGFIHRIQWRWAFRYLWVMQAKSVPLHE